MFAPSIKTKFSNEHDNGQNVRRLLMLGMAMGSTLMLCMTPAMAQETPPAAAKTDKQPVLAVKPATPPKDDIKDPAYEMSIKLFDSFDLNKDGKVEDYETSQAARYQFRIKDVNKDGKILPFENIQGSFDAEVKLLPLEQRAGVKLTTEHLKRYETWFFLVDTNNDKVITEYENLRFFREEFAKFDPEKKGYVTREDYIAQLRARFKRVQ